MLSSKEHTCSFKIFQGRTVYHRHLHFCVLYDSNGAEAVIRKCKSTAASTESYLQLRHSRHDYDVLKKIQELGGCFDASSALCTSFSATKMPWALLQVSKGSVNEEQLIHVSFGSLYSGQWECVMVNGTMQRGPKLVVSPCFRHDFT